MTLNKQTVKNTLSVFENGLYDIFISVAIVLLAWSIFGSQFHPHTFPDIIGLINAAVELYTGQTAYLPQNHVLMTLARIALVFLIALPVGVSLGIGMGRNQYIQSYLSPYILISLAFPSIVVAYLGVIWFGLTVYLVPVFVGVVITTPYAVINMWEGTRDIDQALVEMASSFGASKRLTWRYVIIPQLAPYIFAMMRVVLSVSWKVMLVAEIFGVESGLGFVINEFLYQQRTDLIIAMTLPVMIVIILFERLLKRIESRAFAWRADTENTSDVQLGGA